MFDASRIRPFGSRRGLRGGFQRLFGEIVFRAPRGETLPGRVAAYHVGPEKLGGRRSLGFGLGLDGRCVRDDGPILTIDRTIFEMWLGAL